MELTISNLEKYGAVNSTDSNVNYPCGQIAGRLHMNRIIKTACIICLLMLMFTSCKNSSELNLSENKTDPCTFIYGAVEGIEASIGSNGFFYCDNSLLRYYDIQDKESYILCSKANCTHLTGECFAYFKSNIFGESACNVAQIDGYLYCTYTDVTAQNIEDPKAEKTIQLIQIDLSDGTRDVVASFPCYFNAAEGDDSYYADSIGTVGYCNGYAWFTLTMKQAGTPAKEALQYSQITGVNLQTGEVIVINEPDGLEYNIQAICPKNLYYSVKRIPGSFLSENEYYDLADDKGKANIDGISFDAYSEYNAWFQYRKPAEYEIYSYSLVNGERTLIADGSTVSVEGRAQTPPKHVYGEYQEKTLWMEYLPNDEGAYDSLYRITIYLHDPTTGTDEKIVDLDNGGPLSIAQGFNGNLIFSDGLVYYAVFTPDDHADIYRYDCNTMESTFLFTDNENITFRIYGEQNGGYVGKHKDYEGEMRYYWISKEDFFSGNLDAMVHYDVG